MTSDVAFLGLRPDDDPATYRFVVEDHLSRMDGMLYGGTAIAVSIATASIVTERSPLWMTTQFVSSVSTGSELLVRVEVLAPARRTNQVRVTGSTADGAVVFASLGATGIYREDGLTGEFENPPEVSGPDEAEGLSSPFASMAEEAGIDLPETIMPRDTGFASIVELRSATIRSHPDPGPGRVCVWVRRRDREPVTPAQAAFLADMVPMSIARACGVMAGGTSLDNTIRMNRFEDAEWILLDLRPHLAVGDYGHGTAHVWSESGRLLATASQTASMMRFDPGNPPWSRASR